jgi:hypothetical protein
MAANGTPAVPPHDRSHFRIERFAISSLYTSRKSGRTERPLAQDRREQGIRLTRELNAAYTAARARVASRTLKSRGRRPGVYVEVQSQPNQQIPELTWMRKGLRLGAVRTTQENIQIGSLFVPDKALGFLEEKLGAYANDLTAKEKIPHRDRFEYLGAIKPATIESLWTDRRALPANREAAFWWECWTWQDHSEELRATAREVEFEVSDRALQFPEIEIIPLFGSIIQMETLIQATSAIEQLCYASDSPVFFTTTVQREQHPWVDGLLDRIVTAPPNSPAVCLLDTGVARSHPLIEGSLSASDCLTVNPIWGTDDNHPLGHGTNMAGSILFDDLTYPLGDQSAVQIPFILESVKLIPPELFPSSEPESYGR